jgi:hypothetical protein
MALLEFQVSHAPFRGGIDEGTDPKQVPFGTLLTAKNVVWEKSGRLQKRCGATPLSAAIVGGGSISAAKRLVVRGTELSVVTGTAFYTKTAAGWKLAANLGQLSDVGLRAETIQSGYAGVQAGDAQLTSDGLLVHAWVTGGPVDGTNPTGKLFYQIFDRANGSRSTPPIAFDNSAVPRQVRVLTSGTSWILVYDDGFNLKATVNGAAAVTLKTDGKISGMAFDACIIGSLFVVAYNLEANGIQLASYSIVAVPVLQDSGVVTGEVGDNITAISIDGLTGEPLWIGYFHALGGSSKFRVATANASTFVQILAPTDVDTSVSGMAQPSLGIKRVSSTLCHYAYSCTSGAGTGYESGITITLSITSAGVLGATPRKTAGVRLITRPFSINSKLHVYVGRFMSANGLGNSALDTFYAGDMYLIECDSYTRALPHRYVGKVELLTGGTWRDGHVSSSVTVSSTEILAILPTFAALPTGIGTWWQNCLLATALAGTSLPTDMWRSVQIGPEVYMAAGVLSAYDGRLVFDYGWASSAEFGPSFSSSATGGNIADGTYIYGIGPEYRSAAGILHRGPPNVPRTVTYTASANTWQTTGYVIPVHLSQKYDDTGSAFVADPIPPELVLFRTILAGVTLQRLTAEPNYSVLLQTLYTSPLTFNDKKYDYNIGNNQLTLLERPALYTEGGELPDYQPPAFSTVCLYRDRIFGLDPTGKQWWFSKNHAENPGTAPGFHPSFRIIFNDTMTGAAVLDERLFFFSETGIYYMVGDGPAPNGDGSDYGTPNKLQTDVGCTNPRGIVSTPDGIMFVAGHSTSLAEIHILNRSLSVDWIGKPVQDLLDTYPNVTSAVLVASKNQVRFSCLSEAGTTGIVLVYDYVEKQWSHFVYGMALSTDAAGLAIADACMHGDVYTFVTTTGIVYKESDSTWTDNGGWVWASIETAWVHASGPLAYQSVRNFRIDGVGMSAHTLSISVGFDGNLTYQQGPKVFAEATVGTTTPADSVTANISIGTRRKCRSIRFKVIDGAPVVIGTGQGVKWSTMGIEYGVKTGLGPLPARQKG